MNRRHMLSLLGGAAGWPLTARAQQSATPVVGFLRSVPPLRLQDLVTPFRQGLREAGFVEGQNVAVEYRYAKDAGASLRALAVEFARYGVRANSILPGWITTPMAERGHANPKMIAKVLPRIPARRWGSPEDFAGIAVYLASDASSYHSGDSIVIDGGYTVF